MWIYVGVPECPVLFYVTLTLTSGTSPILLAVGISNVVCGYILGLQSVTYSLHGKTNILTSQSCKPIP